MKKAMFGAGCFWGVEYNFSKLDGVNEVLSGYSGGKTPNPTYEQVCSNSTDHAEVVLIEYDERTSVSLSYNKKEKKIIFNNLIPIKKELEGLYEYYVPDGSNNSYNYKSGKWIFEKDIDARNDKNNNSRKKPKMGLLPSR